MSVEVKSMEIKKPSQQTLGEKSAFSALSQNAKSFVDEVKGEINKITWTSREELLVYTKIVVVTTFLFGMAIYFTDLLIQTVLGVLNFIFS